MLPTGPHVYHIAQHQNIPSSDSNYRSPTAYTSCGIYPAMDLEQGNFAIPQKYPPSPDHIPNELLATLNVTGSALPFGEQPSNLTRNFHMHYEGGPHESSWTGGFKGDGNCND